MPQRYVQIDLKRVAESQFSAEDLTAMATDEDAVLKMDWTSTVIEALEEEHQVETLLMQFIVANYKK